MTQSKNSPARLTLPWPPKALNPNFKSKHWGPKASATKKYRFAVKMLATQVKWDIPEEGPIYLEVEFYPPDRRPRDKDNMSSAFKAGQDGLADAWKINDKRIDPTYKVSDQILGMVKVKLLGEKP
jgi:crossover junction endodeoxyribonuclease RusA